MCMVGHQRFGKVNMVKKAFENEWETPVLSKWQKSL